MAMIMMMMMITFDNLRAMDHGRYFLNAQATSMRFLI